MITTILLYVQVVLVAIDLSSRDGKDSYNF